MGYEELPFSCVSSQDNPGQVRFEDMHLSAGLRWSTDEGCEEANEIIFLIFFAVGCWLLMAVVGVIAVVVSCGLLCCFADIVVAAAIALLLSVSVFLLLLLTFL